MRQRPPLPILLIAALAVLFFALPLVGLLGRVPWDSLGELLSSDLVRDALVLSLVSSVVATALSLLFGVPLAWVLARVPFRGRSIARAVVLLPLVLPPVVGGAALLFAFGRTGVFGGPLYTATGWVLPFSVGGLVLAVTFVAMPFLVVSVEAAMRNEDPEHEEAAATLGAGAWTVFWRVTLPSIRPALVAGAVLTWARALGEFGATVTFAGNVPGSTQTLPLAIYSALETDRDAAVALSLIMVAISLTVFGVLRDRWWGR